MKHRSPSLITYLVILTLAASQNAAGGELQARHPSDAKYIDALARVCEAVDTGLEIEELCACESPYIWHLTKVLFGARVFPRVIDFLNGHASGTLPLWLPIDPSDATNPENAATAAIMIAHTWGSIPQDIIFTRSEPGALSASLFTFTWMAPGTVDGTI